MSDPRMKAPRGKKTAPKPRRFEVWLDKQISMGRGRTVELVECEPGATDEECNEACREWLDTMIGNELDTGWRELADGEEIDDAD